MGQKGLRVAESLRLQKSLNPSLHYFSPFHLLALALCLCTLTERAVQRGGLPWTVVQAVSCSRVPVEVGVISAGAPLTKGRPGKRQCPPRRAIFF